MAGMFYSLTEAAERLGKTEDEVKQLATEGKLREFRDGSNLLFKIEEVNALMAEGLDVDMDVDMDLDLAPEPEAAEPVAEEPMEMEMEPEPLAEETAEEEAVLELDEETAAPVGEEAMGLEPVVEETTDEESPDLAMAAEAESTSELGLTADLEGAEDTSAALSDDDILADMGGAEPAGERPAEEGSEISLAPETALGAGESDITDMDTALTGQGINVLGETDGDYDVTDDSLAETVGPAGTGTEASLEEIEDDVNLDSFGSGSGLLDLSLQADDTSLGGILDEIYTADGGEEAGEPTDAEMVEDMATEADEVAMPEEEMGAPEPMVAAAPAAMVPTIVDMAPDTQSNILGGLLFLPLLALLYAAIVAISAQRGFMPSILESIQGMIWYIVGGAIVVSLGVAGASFVVGGGGGGTRTKAPKKAKKEKKPKEKKAKKEKAPKAEKPKKEKKAKAPKAKKEKKGFFGKKR